MSMHNYYRVGLMALATVIFLAAGCKPRVGTPPAIQNIVQMRSECDQWAAIMKKDFPANSEQVLEARKRYIKAKSETDAWIETVQLRLTERTLENPQYEASLKAAQDAVVQYLTYVQGLKRPARLMGAGLVEEIGKVLIDAGIAFWREARAAAKERIDEIKKQLEGMKWREWDKISLNDQLNRVYGESIT